MRLTDDIALPGPEQALMRSWEGSLRVARDWQESPATKAAAARFTGAGDVEALADVAESVLGEPAWLMPLLTPLLDTLAANPTPGVRRDPPRVDTVLLDLPAATVVASVTSGGAGVPETVRVPGHLSVTRYVKAHGARLGRWHIPGEGSGASAIEPMAELALADGMVVRHDGRREAQAVDGTLGDVVTVSAVLHGGAPAAPRDYRLSDEGMVRAATDDPRREMLRVARRAVTGDLYDAATRLQSFALRWAAMRAWLMLDSRQALPRLRVMADADQHADVRFAAAQTLAVIDALGD